MSAEERFRDGFPQLDWNSQMIALIQQPRGHRMINIPTSVPAKKNKTPKAKSVEPPSPDLRQLVHEIFNQLTVMNLCCFKFRGAAGRTIDLTILADVDRMEKAIADLTVLLENLPRPKTSVNIDAPSRCARRRSCGSTVTAEQRLSPIQAAFTRPLKRL